MSEHTHNNSRSSLWSSASPRISKTFNIEAVKDRVHPNTEYENSRRKRRSGPAMGGGQYRQKKATRHAKASTPFSIRLTPAERERLREDAAGEPLGAYAKKVLFAPTTKAAARRAMIDHHKTMIAQVLAMVGNSGIADALTTLALAIHSGTFEDEAEIKAALNKAESELAEIRAALLKALGVRKG